MSTAELWNHRKTLGPFITPQDERAIWSGICLPCAVCGRPARWEPIDPQEIEEEWSNPRTPAARGYCRADLLTYPRGAADAVAHRHM